MRRPDGSETGFEARPSRRRSWLVGVWGWVALAGGVAQDSAPALLSRTGGGGEGWADVRQLEAAAARGNPRACADLGETLWNGDDVPPDRPRALALLEQAARAGMARAAFRIGMLLDDGDGVPRDRSRALAYFRAAAAGGSMEALHNVGVAYAGGHGVKRDYGEALGWLIVARQRGDESGLESQLREKLIRWQRAGAIAGGEARAAAIEQELSQPPATRFLPEPAPLVCTDPTGKNSPAPVSLTDLGTGPQRATEVVPPTLPAAEEDEGPQVKVTLATGRIGRWPGLKSLQRAVERGDAVAMAARGQLLLEGKLLPQDSDLAVIALERAALAGSPDAAHLLAEIYNKGAIVVPDEAKALDYARQAARGGVLVSIYNVGGMYANGRGTPRDFTQALAWLLVAKHYGLDPGQAQRIGDYLKKTQPAQIAVAEQCTAALIREIDEARAKLK